MKPPAKDSGKDPGFRELVKDSLYYLPARAVPSIAGFIAVAVYSRLLSPKDYGLYVLVMTTVAMVSLLAFAWLNHSILRYLAEYKDGASVDTFISTGAIILFSLLFLISAVWYLLAVVLMDRLSGDLIHLLKIGILVLWAQTGYSLILIILRADRQALRYSLLSSADAIGCIFRPKPATDSGSNLPLIPA